MKVSIEAYAKINLFLDIESIRENGYHNIISYMQSVTLHDTVTVEFFEDTSKHIIISCDNSQVPCNESNLCYKAANIFPNYNKGILKIHIAKVIPMSAGLAGGSADAAATLIALNKIFGNMLSHEELKQIGGKLGADVPFCIELGSCIATGIGEELQKTAHMPNYPILIAKFGDGMSTPEAYTDLDIKFNKFKGYQPHIEKLNKLNKSASSGFISIEDVSSGMFNIFESVVEPKRPYVSIIKKIMIDNNAVSSMMSGSGTSVFGIFKTEDDAINAKDILKSNDIDSQICYPYFPEK